MLTKSYRPLWLNEGLAVYLSEQYKNKNIPTEFTSFIDYHNDGGTNLYIESGFAVILLLKEYGKNKLIEFLKSFNKQDDLEFTKKSFKKHYGASLEYSFFNNLLKKHFNKSLK